MAAQYADAGAWASAEKEFVRGHAAELCSRSLGYAAGAASNRVQAQAARWDAAALGWNAAARARCVVGSVSK